MSFGTGHPANALAPFGMRSHRDLFAWQKARQVTLDVHRYAARQWKPGVAAILDQLRRAALSVQLNIAEGYASGKGPRCRYHLRVAYASAVETTDLLELLIDLDTANGDPLKSLASLSHESQAITLLLLRKTKP